jgi:hypothetical protein
MPEIFLVFLEKGIDTMYIVCYNEIVVRESRKKRRRARQC